ncbi:MAG: ABC transporter substrate-binding protein [Dehalococcoidia bacterium]
MSLPRLYGRRELLRLGGASAVGALFAACGGGDLLGEAPGAPSQKERSGTLRLAPGVGSPSPAGPAGLVYSTLVAFDPRRSRASGDLARSARVDDSLAITFKLREDLRFHPDSQNLASALTAQDVQHDFQERAADREFLFASVIDRVEAPDILTVVLRLRAPFNLLFDYLADPLLASVRSQIRYEAVDARLGSGPFVPTQRDSAGLAMAAHPLFHRSDQPLLEGLLVADTPGDRDLDAAFIAGELDVRVHERDTQPDAAGARAGATVSKRPSRRMRGLGLSLFPQKSGPTGGNVRFVAAFQDVRVRRAISLALDRSAIAAVDAGYLSGPVGPAHAGDALPEADLLKHSLYRRDVAEARKLLDAAGRTGLEFGIEGPNTTVMRAVAQLVDVQLREAGLAPRVNLLPPDNWAPLFFAGDFEAALFELEDLRTPDVGLRLHLTGGLTGNLSLWGYSDPVYDAALRPVFAALDPRERAEESRKAQTVLLDQGPAMFPLSAPPEFASLAPEVRGYEFDAFEFNESRLSSMWRVASD